MLLWRRPVLAFSAGVLSHLALDAIPHWGLASDVENRWARFLVVAKRDGCVGCAAMLGVLAGTPSERRLGMAAAMAGATLPDIDKPAHHFFGVDPTPRWFRRIHINIQKGKETEERMGQELVTAAVGFSAVALAMGIWRKRARAAR